MIRLPRSASRCWMIGLALAAPIAAAEASPTSGPLDAQVDRAIARLAPEMIEVRHQIHHNPELGYEETATSKLVADRLRALGLEVRTGVAKTGIVALLNGGRPGPVVAVRSYRSALPVTQHS